MLSISHGSGKAKRCGRDQQGSKVSSQEERGEEAKRSAISTVKSAMLSTDA